MKSKELVDKYTKIILGLDSRLASITFTVYASQGQWVDIGEIDPEKKTAQDWCIGRYKVIATEKGSDVTFHLASWELYQMPHCCGICVSCAADVHPTFRNKRIGTVLNGLRQDIAKALNYSLLFCTDKENNPPMTKLLATNQWKRLYTFRNRKTGNNVNLSCIDL